MFGGYDLMHKIELSGRWAAHTGKMKKIGGVLYDN